MMESYTGPSVYLLVMIQAIIQTILNNFRKNAEMDALVDNSPYKDNLYSPNWLSDNHDEIINALPDVWTHVENIDYILFGLKMKLLDVPWDTREDLMKILAYLESLNLIIRKNGYQIRANRHNQFNPS